jgi:hypothetical protein
VVGEKMKSIILVTILAYFGVITPRAAQYIPDDTLEFKTKYPNGKVRTVYKGTRRGKTTNLELYDSLGVASLKVTESFETLGGLCYFKDTTIGNWIDDSLINREVGILLDSLQELNLRVDKSELARGTILLWINREGYVEHAIWYWYDGMTRRFMRRSMEYAENWKIEPMSPKKGIIVRRNIDFKIRNAKDPHNLIWQ